MSNRLRSAKRSLKNNGKWKETFKAFFDEPEFDLSDKNAIKALDGNAEAIKLCPRVPRHVNVWRSLYRHAMTGDQEALMFIVGRMYPKRRPPAT